MDFKIISKDMSKDNEKEAFLKNFEDILQEPIVESQLSYVSIELPMEKWLKKSRKEPSSMVSLLANSTHSEVTRKNMNKSPQHKILPKTAASSRSFVPNHRVYPGVKSPENFLDELVLRIKRLTKEKPRKVKRGALENYLLRFSRTSSSVFKNQKDLGFRPSGALLIKSFEPISPLMAFPREKEIKSEESRPETCRVYENAGEINKKRQSNKVEYKVKTNRLEFLSPQLVREKRKDFNKHTPRNILMMKQANSESTNKKTAFSEANSPLLIRSFSRISVNSP